MQVLIADDDPVTRLTLQAQLAHWGYDPVLARDGNEALNALQPEDGPQLALLDWVMPGPSGPDICRTLRAQEDSRSAYLILLTGNQREADIVAGLEAGANDYITKPFNQDELRARLQAGARVLELQNTLQLRVRELEAAQQHASVLKTIMPICMGCKRVRDGLTQWEAIETYLARRSGARFSHGLCPECFEGFMEEAKA